MDSLTLDDLHHLVEGMYCFAVNEPSETRMQQLALDLKEWHESTDEEMMAGLAYYRDHVGKKPELQYDWGHRQDYFENELGYKEI